MASSNDKLKIVSNFKEEVLMIEDLRGELIGKQYSMIEAILKKAYPNQEILKSWVISCLELVDNKEDKTIGLTDSLNVEKRGNKLVFKPKNSNKFFIIILILFISAFLITAGGATYYAMHKLYKENVNKDIDKDGVPDINIDINKDHNSEINIDTNGDNKPDLNIDYKGNRKAVFNIDTNEDGKPDYNLVGSGKYCKLNCDTNDDGWPDINIDLDGDGKPDVDIDTNGDGIADTNIDANGDGIPDINIDTNGDGICDKNCTNKPNNGGGNSSNNNNNNDNKNDTPIKDNGPTGSTGKPEEIKDPGTLVISYLDGPTIVNDVLPDDMKEAKPISSKRFTIENVSTHAITYRLVWKIYNNNFKSNNLKYKISATNGGGNLDYQTVPTKNAVIMNNIKIPARSTQTYTLSFVLTGTNSAQNIDQGRQLNGYVTAEYDD